MFNEITKRFNEGWVMLRRGFDFGDLDEYIPKLSMIYVYSEKSLSHKELSQHQMKELEKQDEQLAFNIDKMSGLGGIEDEVEKMEEMIMPSESGMVEVYDGELVVTLIEGKKVKFYPEEYTIINPQEMFQSIEDYELYELVVEHEWFFKTSQVNHQVHYLRSRGLNKDLAYKMCAFYVGHAAWLKPTLELQQYFEDLEPLRNPFSWSNSEPKVEYDDEGNKYYNGQLMVEGTQEQVDKINKMNE